MFQLLPSQGIRKAFLTDNATDSDSLALDSGSPAQPSALAEAQRKPLLRAPQSSHLVLGASGASFPSILAPLQGSQWVTGNRDPLQGYQPPPRNPYFQGRAPFSFTCQFSQESWVQPAGQVLRSAPSLLVKRGHSGLCNCSLHRTAKGGTSQPQQEEEEGKTRDRPPASNTLPLASAEKKKLRTIARFF